MDVDDMEMRQLASWSVSKRRISLEKPCGNSFIVHFGSVKTIVPCCKKGEFTLFKTTDGDLNPCKDACSPRDALLPLSGWGCIHHIICRSISCNFKIGWIGWFILFISKLSRSWLKVHKFSVPVRMLVLKPSWYSCIYGYVSKLGTPIIRCFIITNNRPKSLVL